MGLLGLFRFRQRRKKKNKRLNEMRSLELHDTIDRCMRNRQYEKATDYVQILLQIKTSPWMHSSSLLDFQECLVRTEHIREAHQIEGDLVHFYEMVIDARPTELFSIASDTLQLSERPFRAALLLYYSSRLFLKGGNRKRGMNGVEDCVSKIADIFYAYKSSKIYWYLISLMEDSRKRLNSFSVKKKPHLETTKKKCLEECDKHIALVRRYRNEIYARIRSSPTQAVGNTEATDV